MIVTYNGWFLVIKENKILYYGTMILGDSIDSPYDIETFDNEIDYSNKVKEFGGLPQEQNNI
jgi:hypothetical protein